MRCAFVLELTMEQSRSLSMWEEHAAMQGWKTVELTETANAWWGQCPGEEQLSFLRGRKITTLQEFQVQECYYIWVQKAVYYSVQHYSYKINMAFLSKPKMDLGSGRESDCTSLPIKVLMARSTLPPNSGCTYCCSGFSSPALVVPYITVQLSQLPPYSSMDLLNIHTKHSCTKLE